MSAFKPLLAGSLKCGTIKFPVLMSPKIDGIRCIIMDGKALTRSLKPVPNIHIRTALESNPALEGMDGEILVGNSFAETSSAVMSHSGTPQFTFHVFDRVLSGVGYSDRYAMLVAQFRTPIANCRLVLHTLVDDMSQLSAYTLDALYAGHEGAMVRSLDGKYKYGRSTTKEGILLKIKPLDDSEAVIVGFEEQYHNTNKQVTNELGRSKRSSSQDGMVGAGTLGNFIVRGTQAEHFGGVRFCVGTGVGLTDQVRQHVWDNKDQYVGKLIKFNYQKIGSIDKPRIPIFLGFRSSLDT